MTEISKIKNYKGMEKMLYLITHFKTCLIMVI